MKRLLLAGGALAVLGMGGALAADLPPKAPMPAPVVVEVPPSFSGFYLGLMVSERIPKGHWTTTGFDPSRTPAAATATSRFGLSSIRGGGFMGFNVQSGNLVYGLEGDGAAGTNIDRHSGIPGASQSLTGPQIDPDVSNPAQDQTSIRLGWDASIRARLGYTVTPNVMIYGTGGGAVQNVQTAVSCTQVITGTGNPALPIGGTFCRNGSKSETFSTNLKGWTAGVGLEALLSQSWTGRIEYRFADYGSFNHVYFANTADQIASRFSLLTHTVSIGIALKFGGGR